MKILYSKVTEDYNSYSYENPENKKEVVDVCEIKKDGVITQRIYRTREKAFCEQHPYLPLTVSVIGLCAAICSIAMKVFL